MIYTNKATLAAVHRQQWGKGVLIIRFPYLIAWL